MPRPQLQLFSSPHPPLPVDRRVTLIEVCNLLDMFLEAGNWDDYEARDLASCFVRVQSRVTRVEEALTPIKPLLRRVK